MVGIPRSSRNAALGAGFLAAVFVAFWFAVYHSGYLQRMDVSAYYGFGSTRGWRHLGLLSTLLSGLINPMPYVVLCTVPFGIALRRGRPMVALGIFVIVLGANLTTEILKQVIDLPRGFAVPAQDLGGSDSFPSGHATAAMTLALCMVLASPQRWRPWVATLGSIGAVSVCYAVLVLGWHYPSDTLGGLLIASIWALAGTAVILFGEQRLWRRAPVAEPTVRVLSLRSRVLRPSEAALVALGAAGALGLLLRPAGVLNYARVHTSTLVAGLAVAVLGILLSTGVMVATFGVRPSGSVPDPTAARRRGWRPG